MNSYEADPKPDPQLKKLESHIQNLPRPTLPPDWKQDILSTAQCTQAATPRSASPQRNDCPIWLSILTEGFKRITPVQATVATIWLLALGGNKFDTWLNGSTNPTPTTSRAAIPYTSLSDQVLQWELAGLEPDNAEKAPKHPKPQDPPLGPRSHRKLKNSSSLNILHS